MRSPMTENSGTVWIPLLPPTAKTKSLLIPILVTAKITPYSLPGNIL